jgi:hypothetical protein
MALFSVWTLFGVQVGLGFPEIRRDEQPCRLALRKGLAWPIYLAQAKVRSISPATSRRRNWSSWTAPITGPSRAISNRYWPASGNLSVVSGLDTEWAMQAEDYVEGKPGGERREHDEGMMSATCRRSASIGQKNWSAT